MKLQPLSIARQNQQNINNNNSNKNTPSFGNAGLVGLAGFIENNGFMGEFLTNDLFGMMGPRVVQGYGRNSEELGHLNYKAGHEETVRELLSGPAYFYVPGAVLGAMGWGLGQTAKVGTDSLDAFRPIMTKSTTNIKDANIKSKFINNFVDEAFSGFENEREQADKIKKVLLDCADGKMKVKEAKKQAGEALTILNKANGQYIDDTRKIKVRGREFTMEHVVGDIKNYLNDFTKRAEKAKTSKNTFINHFHKRARNIRNMANILSMVALSAFLVIIPKLYKTGDSFPGKDGLVKEPKKGSKKAKPVQVKKEEAVNANK